MSCKLFFGFYKEPFGFDIAVSKIPQIAQLKAAADRFAYALDLGAA